MPAKSPIEYHAKGPIPKNILTYEIFKSGSMNYIFLDKIQMAKGFEKAANSLRLWKNIALYITGSNAYFLSGDLATLLSGRYISIEMAPLSFREYCARDTRFTLGDWRSGN